jgi:hypothetical protein
LICSSSLEKDWPAGGRRYRLCNASITLANYANWSYYIQLNDYERFNNGQKTGPPEAGVTNSVTPASRSLIDITA